ncbi:hypothetical protein FQN57_003739 [Myotisia sp. PD_48]|nr:hypothetical protein FQN57_003739 [Myotisia sp. PD_48]
MIRLHTIGELSLLWISLVAAITHAALLEKPGFGRGRRISVDGHSIPGWQVMGEGFIPELLSDRIILTPPYPGNLKGGVWADDKLTQTEWSAQLDFRVNGEHRSGGSLQIWYVTDGKRAIGTSNIYTVGQFDGLAITIDTHNGRGAVRGFLNDGTTDYKKHANVDSLAFGRCEYNYRNLGRQSTVQIKQTHHDFEILVDGQTCFKSEKVFLPSGNFFGVTASSAEDPDSFEAFKFAVNTPDSNSDHQAGNRGYESQHRPAAANPGKGNNEAHISNNMQHVKAGRSTDAQLQEIESRIKEIYTHTNKFNDEFHTFSTQTDAKLQEIARVISHRDQVASLSQRLEGMERLIQSLQREVEKMDYQGHFNKLQEAVEHSHRGVIDNLQDSSHRILSSAPRMGTFIFLIVAVQIGLAAAYVFYKKRRAGMPKKYL